MESKIGWKFPLNNGGRSDGYNDSGIAHFKGSPQSNLVRETIQNSLDAPKTPGDLVHVSFEILDFNPKIHGKDVLGKDELIEAISACEKKTDDDAVALPELRRARELLKQESVPCLRISDRNTTGLRSTNGRDHFKALVKMQGVSVKSIEKGAGGSHGIGKNAPFAVSIPRTVFYWTCYEKNGEFLERFQGKSILMSHDTDEGETQGSGFYGIKEKCQEINGDGIPSEFRVLASDRKPVEGTSLLIVGFLPGEEWRNQVAKSVIENFFFAIDKGTLAVIIEPDNNSSDSKFDDLEINQDTLSAWFDHLKENDDKLEEDSESSLNLAEQFRNIYSESSQAISVEKQDTDIGHCKLWIQVGEGLPSKVGFVRRTGMLITSQQSGLIQFRGYKDFLALCVFEDPDGNELLRRMENPQHDQFQPDWLSEDEKARGRRALKRITDWVRQSIKDIAGPSMEGQATVLGELATYLPDICPDDDFDHPDHDTEGKSELGFAERIKIELKPIRRVNPPSLSSQEDDEVEGDGDDQGHEGGGGVEEGGDNGSGGPGEGEGTGGTGTRGGKRAAKSIRVSKVRILPVEGKADHYYLYFTAEGSGNVLLRIGDAGDSSVIERNDIQAVTGNSLNSMKIQNGRRHKIEIFASDPVLDRSVRLSAVVVDADSSKEESNEI